MIDAVRPTLKSASDAFQEVMLKINCSQNSPIGGLNVNWQAVQAPKKVANTPYKNSAGAPVIKASARGRKIKCEG